MTAAQRKRAIQRRRRQRQIKRRILCAAVVAALITGASIISFAALWHDTPDPSTKETMTAESITVTETTAPIETEVEPETEETLIKSMDLDADEAYILAKTAMAEAEGEDTEGKALVILTILNRVWSPQFPGTIAEVVSQKNAFSSYSNGRYDRVEPDEDCWEALKLVQFEHWDESQWERDFKKRDESQGSLYFERTPEPGQSTWHSRNLEKLFTHGNHTFYREEERNGN